MPQKFPSLLGSVPCSSSTDAFIPRQVQDTVANRRRKGEGRSFLGYRRFASGCCSLFEELFTPLTGPEPEEAETQLGPQAPSSLLLLLVDSVQLLKLLKLRPETDAVNPAEARERQSSMRRSSRVEVGLTLPSMAEAEPAPLEESRSQLCFGRMHNGLVRLMVLPRQASNEDPLPPDVCDPSASLFRIAKGFR